jgi:hypothetical protein
MTFQIPASLAVVTAEGGATTLTDGLSMQYFARGYMAMVVESAK